MYDRMLFLIVALGVSGLILTRDLFNVFVFLEITSLGVYGLIGRGGDTSLQAGFKYMIAGGMASILFLIGTAFLYRLTGTLNLDDMAAAAAGGALRGAAAASALTFLSLAFLIELKPFPANGWALDAYQSASSGVGALLSSAQATAVFVAFVKVAPMMGERLLTVISVVGVLTFFFANLIGMKQKDDKRMLGYSSTGQVGLALFAWTMSRFAGIPDSSVLLIVGGFLLTHMFAKAGLFWLTGVFADSPGTKNTPFGRISAGVMAGLFIMALLGLPPFPSFFAKWELVKILIVGGRWWLLAAVFLGSLFEAAYLFSWLVRKIKPLPADGGAAGVNGDSLVVGKRIGPDILTDSAVSAPQGVISSAAASWGIIPAVVLLVLSAFWAFWAGVLAPTPMAPFAAALVLLVLAVLPGRLRGILAVAATAAAAWWVWPRTDGIDRIFAMLFLVGGSLNLFAGLYRKDKRVGFWAFSTMTVLGSGALVLSSTPLEFFMAWEVVSVGVVLIVLQGRRAAGPSRTGLLFALGGGYLLMTVLGAWSATGGTATVLNPTIVMILAAAAFLVKAGSLGVHLWLPGSYAEADDDASSLLSSVIGKVSIWAMMIFSIRLLPEMFGMTDPQLILEYFRGGPLAPLASLLGWIGAITALGATLVAVFQEDIKYTLAWSSMGQVGYIILAFSLFDHFGWTTAIYLSLNHFIFKAMLFLAVAGIILRVKTRLMNKMGGLIAPMPITFISVLMAIIALSGVPPLSGFGGKWLVYTALIEGGRPLQAAMAMFASGIAFLYLFRLIHSMFLGQRKDDSAGIKEAPAWLIIPQVVLMAALMAISSFPSIILTPVMSAVGEWIPASLAFQGSTLMSALGNWDGSWVMYVTMGVFILPLLILLIGMRKPRKVKQFNIVYAAERPHRPETTHYAHNFFAPYRKALGFLLKPAGRRFWEGSAAGAGAFASAFRRIYTGNGQTYALHIVLFAVVVALFAGVIA
ncbi:MAG: proton-conducting transporter membrane subunit, partial [Spirochaetaceae bacterium]|nr:proton-conducting transporter membrane subunit [Spirochaetaceae bacterium]